MHKILSLCLAWSLVVVAVQFSRAQEALPVGSNPPALSYDYFPGKAYAVVWRNWNIVDEGRIARTLGCTVATVRDMASSMGLPPARPVPADFKTRAYISVIRRNWQLLPYDQLLTLAGMSREHLSVALREDDFLFIKLGGLKPKCEPVSYRPPDARARARAREIKQTVQQYFASAWRRPEEPRFDFVRKLSAPPVPAREVPRPDPEALRFVYSYFGVYGDPLIDTTLDPYPDGLLARLAQEGVNGVWMHVVLNQLAPGGKDFPAFGRDADRRLESLRRIVDRAAAYGIKVYLYMNEPRAMPVSFFKSRPGMAGVKEGDLEAMCTSDPRVTAWLTRSLYYVFRHVPGLGGIFTITASENLTSCASHGRQAECPRCSKRSYADIIASVNQAMEKGVHAASPDARVIVWDWGWNDAYAQQIIRKLPRNVWFMSVSEWAEPFTRGGVSSRVGEYSLSVVGPGPRAREHWAMAREAGLKTVAKIQVNNSWELSAVPWLPVEDLVARHASRLASRSVDGEMLSWSLGGYPSVSLEVIQAFDENPHADTAEVLTRLAVRRYGPRAAPLVRKAWTAFSRAMEAYPYHTAVLYYGPQQLGPANLLFAAPTGYHATMVGFPYDDLSRWRGIYPPAVFIDQFDSLARGWKKGLDLFGAAVSRAAGAGRTHAGEDLGLAWAAYLHFASTADQARFVLARDSLLAAGNGSPEALRLKKEIGGILDREIARARKLYDITRADSRVGFEASNQYYYFPQDLIEKVIDCEYVRRRLTGAR